MLEGLKQQTVKTKWITAEVDRITALFYFVITISLFIAAFQLSSTFIQHFTGFLDINSKNQVELGKQVILMFAIVALIAVSYMLILRTLGLQEKSSTVFGYLATLGAIKINKEDFKTTLQEIERYLNDNEWTLAKYWVDRIQTEYSELFLQKTI